MEDGIEFWFPESIEYRMMQYFWCIIRNYILVCSVYFSTVMVFTFVIVFAFIAHNSKRLSRITYRLLTQYTSFRLVLMGNFMGICNDSGWMWVRKGTGMLWHYTLNIFLFVNLELKFNPRPHPEFELYLLTIKYHASQYYFVFFRCSYSESLSVFMTWQNTGGFDPKWKRKHEKKKIKGNRSPATILYQPLLCTWNESSSTLFDFGCSCSLKMYPELHFTFFFLTDKKPSQYTYLITVMIMFTYILFFSFIIINYLFEITW